MSMDKDSFRHRPSAGTRLATSRWDRPEPTMRPDARARSVARALRVEAAAAESWFSLTTAAMLFVTAAVATAATVQAYGPVFLPPLIGP
jgi:hypothetical protein